MPYININWCFWAMVLEKTLQSPLDCKEIKPVKPKGNQSWIFIRRTDVSWSSNTLATWCEKLTHWKRLWCWEGLGARGEGDDRGWDGWMISPTRWTWVWASSGSWWWAGKPGAAVHGWQRVRHDLVTELNGWICSGGKKYSRDKNLWTVCLKNNGRRSTILFKRQWTKPSQRKSHSGTFPMSQLFISDDQNTGVSTSASVLVISFQGWFPLRLICLISLLSKGLSRVLPSTTVWKYQFLGTLLSLWSSSHNCMWPLGRS